jgi:hypothetical protein
LPSNGFILRKWRRPLKKTSPQALDPRWTGVYKIGGVAAIAAVGVVLIETAIILATGHFVTPSEAVGWFPIFQSSRAAGLVAKGVLDIAVAVLLVPMYLGIYHALMRQHFTAAVIGLAFAFIGIASYLPMNQAIYLLHSSDLYNATASSADKAAYLIQGQAAVAIGRYGMFWSVGFLVLSIGGFVISVAIFRGSEFSKATGYVGAVAALLLIANAVSCFLVPVDYGWTSTILASCGGLFTFVWWILIGFRLLSIARSHEQRSKAPGRRSA